MPEKLTAQSTFVGAPGFSLADCLNSDLSGIPFRPDCITPTYAGARSFAVPTNSETETVVETFDGVIAHHHPLNEFHTDAFQFLKKPPVCVSYDGINAVGNPGGKCDLCPHKAGKHGSNGTCKAKRRLFVLLENAVFPYEMIVPANSMRNYVKYVRHLLCRGLTPGRVVTRFSVERRMNRESGKSYSQIQFEYVRTLDVNEQLYSQKTASCLEELVIKDLQARQERMHAKERS